MLEVALSTTSVVVTLLALVIAIVVWYYGRNETATDVTSTAENGTDVKAVKSDEARPKAQKNLEQRKKGKAKDAFQHAWLICSLHGHTGPINDFTISPDGKRLLSISGRDFIVWHTKDWETSEHAADRSVVNFDTPTRVAFASDSKSLAVSLKNDKKLSIFQLIRRQGKSSYVVEHFEKVQFEVGHREQDITRIAVSSNNKFFVSASSDCHVVIYDFTGHILDRLDPKVNHLYDVVISPDAKYLAVAGFTSDVLVYEVIRHFLKNVVQVEFSREGAYKGVKKAFNIVGQNSGVFAVSFSQYSDRALTVSKDGYWRLFDTHMRSNDDAPRLLSKGEWSALRSSTADNVHASLSPSGRSFAIAIDGALRLYCGEDSVKTIGDTGILCESFFKEKVLDEGNVGIAYSPCGRMVVLAGGRVIRVFKNIPETLGDVAFYEKALKEMSGADPKKRRVEEQLAEARQKLSEALK